MLIDMDIVCCVVKLVCIKVEEDVLLVLVQEFNVIFGFIEQLEEVDVDGVELMILVML